MNLPRTKACIECGVNIRKSLEVYCKSLLLFMGSLVRGYPGKNRDVLIEGD